MKILHHPHREDIQLSSVLHALSDPVRLQIISDIAAGGEQPCNNFDVPIAKSTLTHHIRTLREAGVIQVRVQGTQHIIALRSEDLNTCFPGLLSAILNVGKNTNK
ncbi:ArsR/SmtB family transcription factor [Paenibacillus monticola]|uniref:Helix-turn-helix domain-containing protein n=1 Tax=Paenibacillus monticola TaxID=2666075 RepID=A0A7X2H1A2_9BACL|nr:helix-turn-helix transcriptional regulator [Paenibacillus monticola]MRN51731.1 helix-turn-helix domain-containing protein [Paenibacillus monticola]